VFKLLFLIKIGVVSLLLQTVVNFAMGLQPFPKVMTLSKNRIRKSNLNTPDFPLHFSFNSEPICTIPDAFESGEGALSTYTLITW
jgi:hypothetical protein